MHKSIRQVLGRLIMIYMHMCAYSFNYARVLSVYNIAIKPPVFCRKTEWCH